MSTFVFDIETDGLKPTKIWCVGIQKVGGRVMSTTSYDKMRKLFKCKRHTFIAHNGKRFDKPVLERILGIKIKARLIDTLFLAWYLEPKRVLYGLDSYGKEAGIPKPPIDDWENLSIEEYLHRVEEDVKINMYVWEKHQRMLNALYDGNQAEIDRLIDFLMLHADIAADQERFRWKLDVPRCEKTLEKLIKLKEEAFLELEKVMPKVPVYKKKSLPKRDKFKRNGEMCEDWKKWYALLKEQGLPEDYEEDVKFISSYKEPNAGSVQQIKDWCFSLGWKPTVFEYKFDKEKGERKIPQLRIKTDDGPMLAPCVERLLDKEPNLKWFVDTGVLTHRISILKGFLDCVDDEGYIMAQMQGFTNTLRWRHKVVLNLPGVDKPYGEDIRGCLIAPDGYELVGSDCCALEDRTKQHYMWPYDPEYVKSMMAPGYCPHCDIAVQAGFLTEEQYARYSSGEFIDEEDEHTIKAGRKAAKPVNYGGVYGQKPEGLSKSSGIPLQKATFLYNVYWERNWSVLEITKEQETKKCNGVMWLKNPVSGFWYYLKNQKDIFSTLNQGTGSYAFTMWVKHIRDRNGPPIIGSMHDEVIGLIRKKEDGSIREAAKDCLFKAMVDVNKELKLNRDLEVSVDYGNNYAEIH